MKNGDVFNLSPYDILETGKGNGGGIEYLWEDADTGIKIKQYERYDDIVKIEETGIPAEVT
jgi:hypothetical protein